jgi:MFS family permease
MIIGHGVFAGQQYCGILVILTYTASIFLAAGSTLHENTSAVIVGLIQFVGSYVSTLVLNRVGRKLLLILSFSVMTVSLFLLGLYFFLQARQYDVTPYGLIPILAMCAHVFAYAVGAGPVPYAVIAETMAPKIRAIATSSIIFSATIFAFSSVKLFSILTNAFGIEGCFWFFCFFSALSAVFTYVYIPETKGRRLEDVLAELNGDISKEDLTDVKTKMIPQ